MPESTHGCLQCGMPIVIRDWRSRRKIYCSPKCGSDHHNDQVKANRKLTDLKCLHCRRKFSTHRLSQKFCSVRCRNRALLDGEMQTLTCRECGLVWNRVRTSGKPSRCEKCRVGHRTTGLFKKYGKRVLDRDGWHCQLCDRPIDPRCAMPDPGTRTLDHIIPVALGGECALENLRPAHFACNQRRGYLATLPVSKYPTDEELAPHSARRSDMPTEKDAAIVAAVMTTNLTMLEIAQQFGYKDGGHLAQIVRRIIPDFDGNARRVRMHLNKIRS